MGGKRLALASVAGLVISLLVSTPPSRAASAAPPLPADRLHFGLANDPGHLNWMTSSGVPWKYRYQYLSGGVNTGHGWETWNSPSGQFAAFYLSDSGANGYIPVFSYYELLESSPSSGGSESDRDFGNLVNDSTMNSYYGNFKLLMQKAGAYGKQVVVQVEPDFWGYAQQKAGSGSPASSLTASVARSGFAEAAGLPDTLAGFGAVLGKLRDTYAPNVLLAGHASMWASGFDLATFTGGLDVRGIADRTVDFLASAGTWDAIFTDVDDHDAGWWEIAAHNPAHWWDTTNVRFPNFARWLAWVGEMHARSGKQMAVWQVPVGNQRYLTMNNTDGHFQDNVAEYFMAHTGDLFRAGLVAVMFGPGNAGSTSYDDAKADGVTNNGGAPTTDLAGGCNACNTQTSVLADDDGGYLRVAIGQYYQAAGCSPAAGVPPAGGSTFYFAEGFTGVGFEETLALLMPGQSGNAFIDFYTEAGHTACTLPLTSNLVSQLNVNQAVGGGHPVSARVTLPAPGVAERVIHFQFGGWHGSTDIVGATQPASEWDFAEGSTLPVFNEFLTLQNPNTADVVADLNYFTDSGSHPTKAITLPAESRTTVEVFTLAHGVGPGVQGVSVQVKARGGAQIIAERPMYANGLSFGPGPINDGHIAFGSNGAGTSWNFAEGTTLGGFNEYLTLQNPGTADAAVSLRYITDTGAPLVKTVTVGAQSRATVQVFDPAAGAGPGWGGVSTQLTSSQPIVAERPMYIWHDFGSGPVAGAHDVVGSPSLGKGFAFAQASTVSGEFDYLTIQNPGSASASLAITYYTSAGPVAKTVDIAAGRRQTVEVFGTNLGVGIGQGLLGIVVKSSQPVLVEKPAYSSNSNAYGATDTLGAPAA